MDGGVSDTERSLWDHPCFLSVVDGGDDVTWVVEPVEDTGDVDTLRLLDLVHQAAYVRRDGEHTQAVETTVEHVCLDARSVEGPREGADGLVGVFPVEEVDLLEGPPVGFDTSEATHLD